MTAITYSHFGVLPSRGTSETAGFIATQIQKWRQQLQESYALGQQTKGSFNDLYQIFEDCRRANWDGYGAVPVSPQTLQLAYELLEALPLGTPGPSLGAEPDGQVTFEWYQGPRRTLSVSISPEGELHYAALLGLKKAYGTEPFFGETPNDILELIYRVTSV